MEHKQQLHQNILSQISKVIKERDDFLITTHINPDGDCITSVLSVAYILKALGKRYEILMADPIPEKFHFLSNVKSILHLEKSNLSFEPKTAIVLDASNTERFGNVKHFVEKCEMIINIDHHPSNSFFGQINLVDPEESSTVEIVYHLVKHMDVPISNELATLIYTGIMCDTGRFLFPNTTHRSMRICAEMIQCGASPEIIGDYLYFQKSFDTMKALGEALSTLELHFNGKVACVELDCRCYEREESLDTEGFVDYLMMINGTEVEFLMLQKEPGKIKVSLRSQKYVNVNDVANVFGGGGHARAAGCTIEGTFTEAKEKILKAIKESMNGKVD